MDTKEEIKIRERLVSLETKLQHLNTLLVEIKNKSEDNITRHEYSQLIERLSDNEDKINKILIKSITASTLLGLIFGVIIKYLLR